MSSSTLSCLNVPRIVIVVMFVMASAVGYEDTLIHIINGYARTVLQFNILFCHHLFIFLNKTNLRVVSLTTWIPCPQCPVSNYNMDIA